MDSRTRLLIVDDDRELRVLLDDYLTKNGFDITAVPDGKSMWTALANERHQLVILDLMLPDEDGFSLCRQLRTRSDIPVIMLTARGEETDRIVGLEIGADDYLAKPFSPNELVARVLSLIHI